SQHPAFTAGSLSLSSAQSPPHSFAVSPPTGGSGGAGHARNVSQGGVAPPYNTGSFLGSGSSSPYAAQAHPAQQHINGSNIHAFLSAIPPNVPPGASTPTLPNYNVLSSTAALDPHASLASDPSALQLLPPLPTSLEEKTFRSERLQHLKYIFHFRVH